MSVGVIVLDHPLQVRVMVNMNDDGVDTGRVKRAITYNLVIVGRERLNCDKLVLAVEGNGKLFARRSKDAAVDPIVTSRWARHCDNLSRGE